MTDQPDLKQRQLESLIATRERLVKFIASYQEDLEYCNSQIEALSDYAEGMCGQRWSDIETPFAVEEKET